jgi:hypothetical protein
MTCLKDVLHNKGGGVLQYSDHFGLKKNRLITSRSAGSVFLEAPGGFEPPVKALQASALPLGHGANTVCKIKVRELKYRTSFDLSSPQRLSGDRPYLRNY